MITLLDALLSPHGLPYDCRMPTLHSVHDWFHESSIRYGGSWHLVLPGQGHAQYTYRSTWARVLHWLLQPVEAFVPGHVSVLLSDPPSVEHIQKTAFPNYPKGAFFHSIFEEVLGDGIFNVDGELWKEQRKRASYEFNTRNLRDFMTRVFHDHAQKVLRRLEIAAKTHEVVNMQDLYSRYTLDGICMVGFGVPLHALDFVEDEDPASVTGTKSQSRSQSKARPAEGGDGRLQKVHPFGQAFDTATMALLHRYLFPGLSKWAGWLGFGPDRDMAAAMRVVDAFAYDVIEQRRRSMRAGAGDGTVVGERADVGVRVDLLSRFMIIQDEHDAMEGLAGKEAGERRDGSPLVNGGGAIYSGGHGGLNGVSGHGNAVRNGGASNGARGGAGDSITSVAADGRGGKGVSGSSSGSGPGSGRDKYLRDMLLNFVIAGRDTTSAALAWMTYLMARHPRVVERSRAEVLAVLASNPPPLPSSASDPTPPSSGGAPLGEITWEALQRMNYLHAVMTETLRLYPPVPANAFEVAENDVLPNGTPVERGSFALNCAYTSGRLTSVWGPDALEFRPERFLSEDGKFVSPSPYKFNAFKSGPRLCLGKDMAYLEAKMLMAHILRDYDLELADPAFVPKYSLSLTMTIRHGLPMVVRKRTD
eukprot:jgi/Mesvir1/5311/Mv15405-RA.3